MIGQLLALAIGILLGVVGTAAIYRSNQAINVRRAIASVLRYLDPKAHKPLGELTKKLQLTLELINEADDVVARSEWAKKQQRRFVAAAIEVIKMRNRGMTKADKAPFVERLDRLHDSGDMLLDYLQFPSLLWLKASVNRMVSRWR